MEVWDLEAFGKLAQIIGPGLALLLFVFQQWNKERVIRHQQTKKKDALRDRRDARVEDDLHDLAARVALLEKPQRKQLSAPKRPRRKG